MRDRFLLNPAAGRGRGARQRENLAALARRFDLELVVSGTAEELPAIARESAAGGCRRLFVGGGDGTWHFAAQGLAGSECALVPVPLGTGNDLARELGLPLDAERAIEAGLAAPIDRMDLGRIGDRYFCGVAGSGMDSEVAEQSRSIRRLRGPLVYVWSVVVVLARFRAPLLNLEVDDEELVGPVMLVACANTRYFGGGMRIAPDARRDDGRLDIVVVRGISRRRFLAMFPSVYRGRHLGHPACSVRRAASARFALDRPMGCWGDGEWLAEVGPAGVTVELVPRALAVPKIFSAT